MENYKLKYPKKNVGEIERSRLICSNEREEAFLYDLYNLIGELGYWKFFEDNAKEIKEWKICHHENLISTYPEYRTLCLSSRYNKIYRIFKEWIQY